MALKSVSIKLAHSPNLVNEAEFGIGGHRITIDSGREEKHNHAHLKLWGPGFLVTLIFGKVSGDNPKVSGKYQKYEDVPKRIRRRFEYFVSKYRNSVMAVYPQIKSGTLSGPDIIKTIKGGEGGGGGSKIHKGNKGLPWSITNVEILDGTLCRLRFKDGHVAIANFNDEKLRVRYKWKFLNEGELWDPQLVGRGDELYFCGLVYNGFSSEDLYNVFVKGK